MTVQEAIEYLKGGCLTLACETHLKNRCNNDYDAREEKKDEAIKLSVKALEKQIPKKPIDKSKNHKDWHIMSCPCCERIFWNSGQFMHYEPKWCEKCGQKLDWGD